MGHKEEQSGQELVEQERATLSHEGGRPLPFSLELFRNFDQSSVVVEPVEPLDSQFGRYGGRCFLLHNVLTAEECALLSQEMSGQMSPVKVRNDYRRNDRAIFDSPELAEVMWERVRPVASGLELLVDKQPGKQRLLSAEAGEDDCPDELRLGYGKEGIWRPVGLNESLRFCRYTAGGFFRPHCDGCFRRNQDEQSLFTCMFYLDGDLEGGETRFLRIDARLTDQNYLKPAAEDQVVASIPPERGLCILFFQPGLLHEGLDLQSGTKHILRTDVMFRRDPDSKPPQTAAQREALELVERAQEAEANHQCDLAAGLYRRAFKLDPQLERLF
ncbi:unnamed protein product [Effrenium voratum]|uniref:Fe2OG dioxygenase domain-containing protein n=1 Tax=Effrenium voratum TaxID=2562239 RepID=A0AA36NEF4_9DINO|nr:unnamed protein product [Effrenium voratum]CAJ1399158.1 unnamed protein product [Effrenium voratum]CAJ1454406.1 unnamed protein product [Effrenium voratum]|mmetsp:Transcript_31734/g.75679  ORF Transcript_31734/g.75679 Transcript_31734/m.75679 type:complete len:330 (+) Transcript_31734:60-1049(+)|eukprot:CAMPEP_0181445886 /NCGR_PEP_ID=MMETSP1110-20121109/25819_1 /TAXON_ID=174948 /ORGANISM="Symbiodinium sp., Strain CCMP421" /LENGTH=329 /DNA_ID=CAMNT_0023569945 /DNA_START=58 /DNA_END=1047 /DNA_ORIENTATION=-